MGNVGSEVVRIIEGSADDLAARIGAPLMLRGIGVRRVAVDRDVPVGLLTNNIEELVSRADVDIVVEVMGPVALSRKAILSAILGRPKTARCRCSLTAVVRRKRQPGSRPGPVDVSGAKPRGGKDAVPSRRDR
ncbi:hypothetical protein ACN3XK_74800 [Actinomadura welshii]